MRETECNKTVVLKVENEENEAYLVVIFSNGLVKILLADCLYESDSRSFSTKWRNDTTKTLHVQHENPKNQGLWIFAPQEFLRLSHKLLSFQLLQNAY